MHNAHASMQPLLAVTIYALSLTKQLSLRFIGTSNDIKLVICHWYQ